MPAALVREHLLLSCDAAQQLCVASARRAREIGVGVSIAIVDALGTMICFLKMDDAMSYTAAIAPEKAATAAAFGAGTMDLQKLLGNGSKEVMGAIRRRPGISLLGGGEPIRYQGRVVGGIGVSGGLEEQDRDCACFAIASVGFEQLGNGRCDATAMSGACREVDNLKEERS